MKIAVCSSLLNITLSILFAQFFDYISIVLSNAISLLANIIFVLIAANRFSYYKFTKATAVFILKLLVSCVIMAITIYYLNNVVLYNKTTLLFKIFSLLICITAGGLVYLVSCFALRVHHILYKA
ncbi:mviN-like family protein [Orientia tsutsugamushi str. Sido]|nr:mviN-like family protein [Orientia tsutsugamushi str. Sido]